MKSLTSFLNESVKADKLYTFDYIFDTKLFASEIKKHKGDMPGVKHAYIVESDFYSVDEMVSSPEYCTLVAFESDMKDSDVLAFIYNEADDYVENDNHYAGDIYHLYLLPTSNIKESVRETTTHERPGLFFECNGNYNKFLSTLCGTVNDLMEHIEKNEKDETAIYDFAKHYKSTPEMQFKRVTKETVSYPETKQAKLVKIF